MQDTDGMRNVDLDLDKTPKKPEKKQGGGFFGKFVAALIGVIIGIIAAIGGVGIFGWCTYAKTPIKTSVDTVNGILGTNVNYADYIDGSYGEKTIADLVGDTVNAIDQISKSEGSLNTLNAISPLIGKIVIGDGTAENTGLVGTLATYAIIADPATVMERILVKPEGTPDSDDNKNIYLIDYLLSCVNDASLGDLIQALGYETNDVIKTLCYGIEGTDYTVNDEGKIEMINGATKLTIGEFLGSGLDEQIQLLPLDAFIPIKFPTDTVMCMLAYGPEYRYEKELDANGNVVMTQVFYEVKSDSPFVLMDDEGNEVAILSGADNPQGGIVLEHTVGEGENATTQTRYLRYDATDGKYYAFKEQTYETPILFEKHTVGMLQKGTDSLIGGIYIKDLLNIDHTSDRIMITLGYGKEGVDWEYDADGKIQMIGERTPRTVNDLKDGNLFNELTLKDMLGDDVNSNQILLKLADTKLTEMPAAMEGLTFDDIFADKIYTDDTHTTVQSMWKYLFDDPTTTEIEMPNAYYILGGTSTTTTDKNGVDKMIENMQNNMQTASLGQLVEDGLITFQSDTDKEEFLNSTKSVLIYVDGAPVTRLVKDLTIIEVINFTLNAT